MGLAALAVVTGVLCLLALMHVRPRTSAAQPATVPAGTSTAGGPTAGATTGGSSPRASTTPTPRPRTGDGVRDVMRGDQVDVVVLGDASGAGDTRWVTQVAAQLGRDRAVRLGGPGSPSASWAPARARSRSATPPTPA